MNNFQIYFKLGLNHVLAIDAYDHILFFIALLIPYLFKDWKKVLTLVTIFTVGHTISLLLSVLEIITVKASLIEFLIPVTIFITAAYYLFTAGKNKAQNTWGMELFITLSFGVIHGFGFSNYFKTIMMGRKEDKIIPTLEFALGIECAQALVVIIVLLLASIFQNFLRFSKRDWALTLSAFVIGVVATLFLKMAK